MSSRFSVGAGACAIGLASSLLCVAVSEVASKAAACRQAAASATVASLDRSTPAGTLEVFLQALGRGDMTSATACVEGAKSNPFTARFGRFFGMGLMRWTASDVTTIAGDSSATVRYALMVQLVDAKGTVADSQTLFQPGRDEVKMTKDADGWKIVPADAEMAPKMVALMPSTLATLFAHPEVAAASETGKILDTAEARIAERGREIECLSRVKRICLAVLTYSVDHEEDLPPAASTYRKAIAGYRKDDKDFLCPVTGKPFTFNKALAGVNIISISSLENTVMIYEGTDGHLSFVHAGKAVVGFTDGHCKLITQDEAKKLRWKP